MNISDGMKDTNYLRVDCQGSLLVDGLFEFYQSLIPENGHALFTDKKTGKTFKIELVNSKGE